MDTGTSYSPQLRWVLVEGNLCEVSTFRDLKPKVRPRTYCPLCERQVTLKLGAKRVHHFAHRPDDDCSATHPETAIHLNCKFHIYSQLKAAKELYCSVRCKRCSKRNPILWKKNWDQIEVEYKLDTLRPDIALLQNGRVIGAIEIFVTHAVTEEKAQRFQSQGIDWIEVYGREDVYEGQELWTVDRPLDPFRQYPTPPSWICPQCQENQRREEHKRDHRIEILYARMIDLYYPSGKKYRHTFYVKQAFTKGSKSSIWIEDEHRVIIATQNAPITEQSQRYLSEAFWRKLQEFKRTAAVVDDEMKWTRWIPGSKFVARDIDNFPFRYAWYEDRREWVLQLHLIWKTLG